MAEVSTKERAIAAALELFSRKGYDAASMTDIAQAVGIRAPSLYKHFESKEALFAAAAPRVWTHYRTLWETAASTQALLERNARGPGSLPVERLEQETLAWVEAELAEGGFRAFACRWEEGLHWLWDRPLALYEDLFSRLMERQTIKRADAHVMAVEYLAPIAQLIALSDRDPSRREGVSEEIRRHIRQFHRAFAVKDKSAASGGMRGLFRR